LRARGGFEVDLAWDQGVLKRAVIRAQPGIPCRVRYGDRKVDLPSKTGNQYVFEGPQLTRVPQP
jgi:alpha-L-fucosidase 2